MTPLTINRRSAYGWQLALVCVCLLLYGQDLGAPLSDGNQYRQCQTAMLTRNYVVEGFALQGLHPDFFGWAKPVMVFECPVYNCLSGLLYRIVGNLSFCGKLISLLAGCVAIIVLFRLVAGRYGIMTGILAGLFFIVSPSSLMHLTSFQPDAFGLASVLLSLLALANWRDNRRPLVFIVFCLFLLLGGLAKYPLLVPYMPIIALGWCEANGRFRMPAFRELLFFTVFFMTPFLAWQIYRGIITDPEFGRLGHNTAMFLIGDIGRFLSGKFYAAVLRDHVMLVASGAGIIFLLFGVRRMDAVIMALIVGVPLYYIVVPTVWQQNYYLFACTPIYSLLMARGAVVLWSWRYDRRLAWGLAIISVLFILCSVVKWRVQFRTKNSIDAAASALKLESKPSDLILWVSVNNVGVGNIRHNPVMFFLAERHGWNVGFDQKNLEGVVAQIESKKHEGARWLIVTRNDPAAHTKYGVFRRPDAPRAEGNRIYEGLPRRYFAVNTGANYVVMNLERTSQ